MENPEASESRGLSLPSKILIGLLTGAALGLALNLGIPDGPGRERVIWWADNVAKPAGDVFLRMLFMVVVPLVFSSLVLGVAGLGDAKHLGRLGGRTMAWFIGTTAFAAAIGLLLVNVIAPGKGLSPEVREQVMQQFAGDAQERMNQAAEGTGFTIHTFVNIIPRNIFASAANERETLGVIFFALIVGVALMRIPRERSRTFLDVIETLYEVCAKILGFAMALAPIGVFGLIFAVTSKLGLDVMRSLGAYVVTALAGLLFFQFVVLPAIAFFVVGIGPKQLFRGVKALMITAFSTSSSNATLPTTIKTAIENFNVPKSVAGFVMPLGATMNMNGTALFEGVTVLFLAQVAGVELSLASQGIVILMAVMTAIGSAGVPGGSLPLLTIVLVQVGVPPEMIALVIGTDRIVDMTRTMPNVTSDLLCSVWIAKFEDAEPVHEG